MGEPFDMAAIAGQVRELVEGLGIALDEHRQVIGRNRVFRGAMPFLEEAGDDVLAFAVEFLGLVVRTLREPARRSPSPSPIKWRVAFAILRGKTTYSPSLA
jgi:hypothetical protein